MAAIFIHNNNYDNDNDNYNNNNLHALYLFSLEIRKYGRRDLSRWPRGTAEAGTNFADMRRSLGRIVRLRTKATE
jgi:hypothetical protein